MAHPIKLLGEQIDKRLVHLKLTRGHHTPIHHQAESIVFHYYLKQLMQHEPSRELDHLLRRVTQESRLISEIKPYFRLFNILELAIKENDNEILVAVTDADPKVVNHEFTDGHSKKTALVMAAELNRTELVQSLTQVKGFNPRSVYTQKALNAAILNGNLDIVVALLKAGVIPGQGDFHRACSHGQLEIAKLLNEASPNLFNYNSALLSAVAAGNLPAVQYLVRDLKADVNYSEPPIFKSSKHELSPLIAAIQYKKPEIAQYLINNGATIKQAQQALGLNSLGLAAFLGKTEIVRAEIDRIKEQDTEQKNEEDLEFNADINAPDDEGYTPLMRAAQNGNAANIDGLIAAKAQVNAQNKNGHTALIEAVLKGHCEAVVVLLKVDHLDVNAREKTKGLSAREIAVRNKDTSIVEAIDDFVSNRDTKANQVLEKENNLYELNKIIDSYHVHRTQQKDENGKVKEYLHFNLFGLFQKSYTQKDAAIKALKNVLEGNYFDTDGNLIDLYAHLATLRNGTLGENLRAFIKEGNADSIVGCSVTTVSDFVKALQESIPPSSSYSVS